MAETFLFNVAEKVLVKLGSLLAQEVSLARGVEREFIKLRGTVSAIRAVLLDSEERQADDKQLTDWLGKLKDALYDTEDLFDEFQYEALRSQVVKHGCIRRKVRNFFSRSNPLVFRLKMGHKIKEVSERLDEIAAQKDKFHLRELHVDRRIMHGERETTHSFVRASDVIGRDVDKENIIRLLMHTDDGENISIIPIVGIGGLGKTTLAKLVFNDAELTGHFDLKMWVCVSEDFDVTKITKEICRSAIGKYSNVDDLKIDQLQTELRSTLDNKKYLLIMDDVWNDNLSKWMALKELLLGGANGSKIVVTTRSQSVASVMGSIRAYNLKGLSHKDCMSLFVKWAFKKGEDKQHSNLLEIGDQIVKKCKGVPLAVTTLGSLLYSKIDERDWLHIKDNEIWKFEQNKQDILPALKLSYNDMPSYLKQCFVYFSIFPKGYQFFSGELTVIWMALGLLQSSNEKEDWEAIGNRYIIEFWSRSFLQDFEDHLNVFLSFKMHDLVHDLALSVAQSECLSKNFHRPDISRRIRHVSFSEGGILWEEVSRFLVEQKNVRTVFFPSEEVVPTESFVETCISRFRYVRVLDLSSSSLEALPSSIGNLKHLRYLDISRNRRIKKLPNSICKLHNLQTLSLIECSELEELPRDIGNLINLRSLQITTKQVFLPKEGIGSLISLRYLGIAECANLKSLGDWMRCFTDLRTLVIDECESLEESLLCIMKYLTNLETLIIGNCKKINLMECGEDIGGLNFSLRSLFILGLPQLVVLPQWLQGAANTLQSIYIEECQNLASLPEWLQNFKSLQKLKIEECPKFSILPEAMRHLSALRHLEITIDDEKIKFN